MPDATLRKMGLGGPLFDRMRATTATTTAWTAWPT